MINANVRDISLCAQRQRLLAYLQHDSIDTIAARRDLNIMMPAARVFDLRKMGHNIVKVLINRYDDRGNKHVRVALYTLLQGDGT